MALVNRVAVMLAHWAVSVLSDRAEGAGSKSRALQQHLLGIDGINSQAPPTVTQRKQVALPSCARARATWIQGAGRLNRRSMSFLQDRGRVGAESGGNQQHNCSGRKQQDVTAVLLLFQNRTMDVVTDSHGR